MRWLAVSLITITLNGCSLLSMYPENGDADRSLVPTEGSNGKWGYIDQTHQFVIPPKFDGAAYFSRSTGTAQVSYQGKDCYIDKKGEIVGVTPSKPK